MIFVKFRSQLTILHQMTDEIVIKMSGTNILELCEHYTTADQQGSLLIFSANMDAIPLLYAVKNIQAKKYFLITPRMTHQITWGWSLESLGNQCKSEVEASQ